LLLLIVLLLKDEPGLDAGPDAVRVLTNIIRYALAINLFLFGVEAFTALYSQSPDRAEAWRVAYLDPNGGVRLWLWGSMLLSLIAFGGLFVPAVRRQRRHLAIAAALAFAGVLMEKGMGFVVAGFEPSALGRVIGYAPTFLEVTIAIGIWGAGALVLIVARRAWGEQRAAEFAPDFLPSYSGRILEDPRRPGCRPGGLPHGPISNAAAATWTTRMPGPDA
jgi:molybdopterin-containing oxidoreductase family membrane subunit